MIYNTDSYVDPLPDFVCRPCPYHAHMHIWHDTFIRHTSLSLQDPSREAQDHMESFFPGETLKYLYLLMQPDHPIDLMKYTFNTEAHPLRIFS